MRINSDANKEEQTRAELEREVSALNFDLLWAELKEGRHVAQYLRGETEWEQFVREAEYLETFIKRVAAAVGGYSGPRPGRPRAVTAEVELTDYERECSGAYLRYLSIWADKLPVVARFREIALEERQLSPAEARALIVSPAAGYMSLGWFQKSGVPLVGHTSEVVDEAWLTEGRREVLRITFRIDPPGRTFVTNRRGFTDAPAKTFPLQYLSDEGIVEIARVIQVSALYDLYHVSAALARFLKTDEAAATRYILTNEWPQIPPIDVQIVDGNVGLQAAPWVSEKTVRRAFQVAQRSIRGGDNKPLKSKTIEAFLFVNQHCDERGNLPSWEALRQRWNKTHQDRPYRSREDLWKAYHRAHEVFFPAAPEDPD